MGPRERVVLSELTPGRRAVDKYYKRGAAHTAITHILAPTIVRGSRLGAGRTGRRRPRCEPRGWTKPRSSRHQRYGEIAAPPGVVMHEIGLAFGRGAPRR